MVRIFFEEFGDIVGEIEFNNISVGSVIFVDEMMDE
jgi:hypothetical protein